MNNMTKYDAILIPGGGVDENGNLKSYVAERFKHVLKIWKGEYIICLSAYSVYKRPVLDSKGFPIFEAKAGADFLLRNGIDRKKY